MPVHLDTLVAPGDTGVMRAAHGAVGRSAELARLVDALRRARAGRGAVMCLCGPAGIGKSHLAESFAAAAEAESVPVLWGRAWEAGGAPAWWPWTQALRGIGDDAHWAEAVASIGAHAAHLRQVLPSELAGEAVTDLDAAHAKFARLDAMGELLQARSRLGPLVIVLDDLHAADPSSLQLLEFVAQHTPTLRLVVVATFREPECQTGVAARTLGRMSRHADVTRLHALSRDAIVELGGAVGAALDEATLQLLASVTEGNPLYVTELLRRFPSANELRRALADAAVALPEGVRSAIRDRMADLPPSTQRLLAVASAAGRQFRDDVVAAAAELDDDAFLQQLAPAVDAALLQPTSPGAHRFSHILVREVVYRDLDAAQRREVHRRFAEAIAARVPVGATPPWAELGRHFEHAGPNHRRRARRAWDEAARAAEERGRWEDASVAHARALDLWGNEPDSDDAARVDRLLALAETELNAGLLASGGRHCAEARRLARALDDAERLARAALMSGRVLTPAHRDGTLIDQLQDALGRLPPDITPLRAKVMARLAAARQPEVPPEGPMALARSAIALARRLDDPPTLLEVLHTAISALMDLADPSERAALNEEHIALASRLERPLQVLRGRLRLFVDEIEQGRVVAARRQWAAARQVAEPLGVAHHTWIVEALGATLAALEGRFAEAWGFHESAWRIATEVEDAGAIRAMSAQRLGLVVLADSGDDAQLDAAIEAMLREHAAVGGTAEMYANVTAASSLARAGRGEEIRWHDTADDLRHAMALEDTHLTALHIELAAARGNAGALRELATLQDRLGQRQGSAGLSALYVLEPLSRSFAIAAAQLDEYERAWPLFSHALARAASMGARPHTARILYDEGVARLRAGQTAEGRERLARARVEASQLSMHGLVRRIEARLAAHADAAPMSRPSPRPTTAVPTIALVRDGETWRIEGGAAPFRLRNSKGLRLLARLVAAPRETFHVLDLVAEGKAREHVQDGDLGPVLDPTAKAAYAGRIRDLREALDDAEARADPARAEAARAELEALTEQLAGAVGLGGRDRKFADASERARVNVQRRIRDALDRIEGEDAALGKHLRRSVQTGTYCSYDP